MKAIAQRGKTEFENIGRRNHLPREYDKEMLLTEQEKKLYCLHDYIAVASHVQIHGTRETFVNGKEQKYNHCSGFNQEIFAQHLVNGSREMLASQLF